MTRPTPQDRIRAALWFAERGFGVFSCWSTRDDGTCRCPTGGACSSPGKHPITLHGFQDATRDPARIRTLLTAGSEPNYGLVPPEGVCVWDVDTDDVRDRLAALEARLGPLPATLRTDTGNGQHVFWRWPEGHPRPLHAMFGIVTRWGTGRGQGYVIGPRSVHASGREYRPAGVFDIATLPDTWAAAALEGDRQERDPGTIRIGGTRRPEDVEVGGRHDYLRDRARHFAGTVRDPDALFAAVWALNLRLPQPKTEEEVRRAIGDALERFGEDQVEQDPETGRVRVVPDDEPGILPPVVGDDFPEAPDPVAFGGLLGECVEVLARGTDAATVGLLVSFLAVCGAMVPAHAYSRQEQTSSPFVALVGPSGEGRKGTAMNRALDCARLTWQADHVNQVLLDGLNSGEALVSALHERKSSPYNQGKPVVGLVFEEEYVSMLASRSREGSTLDAKLRVAFDGGSLSNRRSAESKVVQPPYWLPALAAITPRELRTRIEPEAAQTGSANRWLYVPVTRRKVIAPDAPPVLPPELVKAMVAARGSGQARRIEVDPDVGLRVSEYADFVIRSSQGIALDLVKRYATIAFRLALVHAAVERSQVVEPRHLDRSIAVTEYARRGIAWVFGETVGNRDADLLLRNLKEAGTLRKNVITRHVVRDPIRQQDAIDELVRLGYATVEAVTPAKGGKRTELRWTGLGGAFIPFVRPNIHPTVHTHPNRDGHLDERPGPERETGRASVDDRWTNDGRSMDERWTNDPVVDASTGETDSAPTWASPCSDYPAHRDSHRRRDDGWVCPACNEALCPECGAGPFISREFHDRHRATHR